MRIITCDDEKNILMQLEKWIMDYFTKRNMEFSFEKYQTGASFIRELEKYDGEEPIIILMDIQLPRENNGIDMIKKIYQWHGKIAVIFVSGYTEYAEEVFDVDPIYFLVKPLKHEKFERAMGLAIQKVMNTKEELSIVIQSRNEMKKIFYRDILYIESALRKTKFHCLLEEYECYEKLDILEKKMGNGFIRCHKSFLVNLAHVNSLKRKELILDNGQYISISNSKMKGTKEAVLRYLSGLME